MVMTAQRLLCTGLLTLALLAVSLPAMAGAIISDCRHPLAYGSAVNAYVLQYNFTPTSGADTRLDERLRKTARQLSLLIKLDALFGDSYGSLGAILVIAPESRTGACSAEEVLQGLLDSHQLGRRKPNQGLTLLWGRIFREGDEILVQTYLRFLRVYPGKPRTRNEQIQLSLEEPALSMTGRLPAQSVAFSPRGLRIKDLEDIDSAFRKAARLHRHPSDASPSEPLPIDPDFPIAYAVHEITPDGWMKVRAIGGGGFMGWLRARPGGGLRAMRRLLPELDYLEAVIGYLSRRLDQDGFDFRASRPSTISARVASRFRDFEKHAGDHGAVLPRALARAMQAGLLAFDGGLGEPRKAVRLLEQAVALRPANGDLHNLLAMARMQACCTGNTRPASLAGVLAPLTAALSVDPGNPYVLSNLEALYAYALNQAGAGEFEMPEKELSERLSQVRELRAALNLEP